MKTKIQTKPVLTFIDGFPTVLFAPSEQFPEGAVHRVRKLLSKGDDNTKLRKSIGHGFQTVGFSGSPSTESGIGDACPWSSPGCETACLDHQGLASVFATIRLARMAKTVVFRLAKRWFLETLRKEIAVAERKAELLGDRLAVRLNVFSDFLWERLGIIELFPNVEFYDYSKSVDRAGLLLPNYWVTFSRSESNQDDCLRVIESGKNVSVVWDTGRTGNQVSKLASAADFPKTWFGFPVLNGDLTDLRFDDPRGRLRGRVVGLRLKAASRSERLGALESGFAIPRKASK